MPKIVPGTWRELSGLILCASSVLGPPSHRLQQPPSKVGAGTAVISPVSRRANQGGQKKEEVLNLESEASGETGRKFRGQEPGWGHLGPRMQPTYLHQRAEGSPDTPPQRYKTRSDLCSTHGVSETWFDRCTVWPPADRSENLRRRSWCVRVCVSQGISHVHPSGSHAWEGGCILGSLSSSPGHRVPQSQIRRDLGSQGAIPILYPVFVWTLTGAFPKGPWGRPLLPLGMTGTMALLWPKLNSTCPLWYSGPSSGGGSQSATIYMDIYRYIYQYMYLYIDIYLKYI